MFQSDSVTLCKEYFTHRQLIHSISHTAVFSKQRTNFFHIDTAPVRVDGISG